MSDAAPLPSRFGRYEVQRVVGRGAMGIVYLADDPVIGRQVAIKAIQAHAGLDPKELAMRQERFEREFRSAGTLSHPNIVTVYDVGQEGSVSFIAMEYVPGESLEEVFKSGRTLSFKEITDILGQIASGLDYAHERSIVHRDVKPANILLTVGGQPKITDFGVAKLTTTSMTTTGMIVGTPMYMAPEQITGRPVVPASDQFALAVILYEMLTGERPFEGDNPTTVMYRIVHEQPVPPRQLNGRLPEGLDGLVLRGLSKKSSDRYASCSALAAAVGNKLGVTPDETGAVALEADATLFLQRADLEAAAPVQPRQEVAVPPGSKRWLIAGAAAVLLVVGGWLAWRSWAGGSAAGSGEGASATAAAGTVEVVSNPAGAEIWADGAATGLVTPAFVPISGEPGKVVDLALKREGKTLARTQLVVGPALPPQWSPALAAAPQRFEIASEPPGARVVLDGEPLAQPTPVAVELAPEGRHEVVLELAGYDSRRRGVSLSELTAAERESGRLEFALAKTVPPGFVRVAASYPVQVSVDGRRASGDRLGLPPGRYRVELSAPSVFWRDSRTVEIASGETVELAAPRAVAVTVGATPGNCQVKIDGRDVGFVPANVQLAIGTHSFDFAWGGGQTLSVTEEIRPDTTRVFRAAPG
jgi:tRNA A-37 threonylcarbamoyl transferase component Bud32